MVINELLELERRGWESLCDGTGADFYGRLMTEEGVMVLAHGEVFDRQLVVESLNDAPPWRAYEIDQERLIPVADGVAVLVYRGQAFREEAEPAFVALMASTYVRRGDGWALACYQQTPIPGV